MFALNQFLEANYYTWNGRGGLKSWVQTAIIIALKGFIFLAFFGWQDLKKKVINYNISCTAEVGFL